MNHDTINRDALGAAEASCLPESAAGISGRRVVAVLVGGIVMAALLLLVFANQETAQAAKKAKKPPTAQAAKKAKKPPTPFLVKDIYPGPLVINDNGTPLDTTDDYETGSAEPSHLVDFKGTLLFGAADPRYGEELWKSRSTRASTVLVKDLYPGPFEINDVENEDDDTGSAGPDKLALLKSKSWVYFAATTGTTGEELFKSDGTAKGTTLVKDIEPGPRNLIDPATQTETGQSGAEDFVSVSATTTFFRAFTQANGEELWKTDGTEAGTVLVKDINPDPGNGLRCPQNRCGLPMSWSHPDSPAAMGKTVFFAADDGTHGVELWKSDGTEAGTVLVKDINTTAGNSNPNDTNGALTKSAEVEKLFVVDETLYFRANDGVNGVELWKSDGTEAGTVMVKNINTAAPANTTTSCKRNKNCAGGSWVDDFTRVGNTVFFSANNGTGVELWKSDGTEAGTVLVKNIHPSTTNTNATSRLSNIGNLVAVGNTLYLSANDGTHGVELWKSDGTEAGTVLVKDINTTAGTTPGTTLGSDADQLRKFNGNLLFRADDGVNGLEMWSSNGTEAGTKLLLDIEPGAGGSEPGELTTSGRFLYFSAIDPNTGEELWAVSTGGRGGI